MARMHFVYSPTWKCQTLGRKKLELEDEGEAEKSYLCAWGNDAASEVITEARQLLVENYFQTPSLAPPSSNKELGEMMLRRVQQKKKWRLEVEEGVANEEMERQIRDIRA
ncbi:hypothetical protein Scep_019961 [Stephania cephalantha]|uniref:Uncharacterized protein n=1 Tax=Stephania cephalantha TaxID=152367 RepID=A0AAP0IC98_9MAGN